MRSKHLTSMLVILLLTLVCFPAAARDKSRGKDYL